MHRTESLDYVMVVSGEIVLRLDSGEEKTIRASEYIIQRGVNHEWHNRSESVCRIAVVMVGAAKIVAKDGTEMGETKINVPGAV
jgi:quercetin dioxygenase-like cupin family protein